MKWYVHIVDDSFNLYDDIQSRKSIGPIVSMWLLSDSSIVHAFCSDVYVKIVSHP